MQPKDPVPELGILNEYTTPVTRLVYVITQPTELGNPIAYETLF